MELTGVTIECAAGPSDRIAERFSALLDLAAPAFENSHPRFGGSATEEGEVHAESVIGVVLRSRVGDQLGEAFSIG